MNIRPAGLNAARVGIPRRETHLLPFWSTVYQARLCRFARGVNWHARGRVTERRFRLAGRKAAQGTATARSRIGLAALSAPALSLHAESEERHGPRAVRGRAAHRRPWPVRCVLRVPHARTYVSRAPGNRAAQRRDRTARRGYPTGSGRWGLSGFHRRHCRGLAGALAERSRDPCTPKHRDDARLCSWTAGSASRLRGDGGRTIPRRSAGSRIARILGADTWLQSRGRARAAGDPRHRQPGSPNAPPLRGLIRR